jgi:hypothetical protein
VTPAWRIPAAAVVVWATLVGQAGAQAAAEAGPSRFELAAGAVFLGTSGLGSTDATLAPNLGGDDLVLFSTSAELVSPAGVDGRIGVRVAPWLVVSAVASVAWGDVSMSIDGDPELASTVQFDGERLTQARFEGRVDWILTRLRFAGGRAVPYATASVGILQQWHEGYTVRESGHSLLAGGGIRYLFRNRPSSPLSQAGLTAEVQVCRLWGGYHLGTDSRTMPAIGIGLLTGWGKRQ